LISQSNSRLNGKQVNEMTIAGLLGRKIGMTTYYHEDGTAESVTAVEVGPCVVTQVKTEARDGYEAVQLGFGSARRLNSPEAGHQDRSGRRFTHLQEFGVDDLSEFEVGQEIKADVFEVGEPIKVIGTSKGKGFSGVVRRWGFRGGPKTHGQSDRHRSPGSIGAGTSPGRVWPGTKMAGHYGVDRVTVKGLKIVATDPEKNVVLVRGPIPGANNGIVRIEKQSN
jgi:large subunit ribosomal protein L3